MTYPYFTRPLSTPNSSPRKRARRVSPILEPKEGRVSDVPSHLEITKGNAQKLFRVGQQFIPCLKNSHSIQLTAADLNDSDLKFREMSRGSLKGHMHLYNMRAVERLAWKKYGSPEKFDAVYVYSSALCVAFRLPYRSLDKAQALWISKGKDPHAFPRVPRPFRPYTRGKCKQCNSLFSMPSHVIFDKCDRCRGVIPKATVRRDLFDGLMDYEDMDPGEYNEDQLDHYGGGCACCDFFGLA